MRPLDNIGIKNFRIFDPTNGFFEELADITLFTGANNSGKSSIIKCLQMLKNSLGGNKYPFDLDLTDQGHLLGDFQNLLHDKDDPRVVILLPFMFLGMTQIYLSLSFEVTSRDTYRANLRKIEVIDKSDDTVWFQFEYVEATQEEKEQDGEDFEIEVARFKGERDKEKIRNEKTGKINGGYGFLFPPIENPLSGFIDWNINIEKLNYYLDQLFGIYENYLAAKNKDGWLENVDEIARHESMPFIPSSFIQSFKNELNIDDWRTFRATLTDNVISGRYKIGDREFEPDEPYWPRFEIEDLLYSRTREILRDQLKWKNKESEDSSYHVIEHCFEHSWQMAIQRLLSVDYVSTAREQNSRIYHAGNNSPFINLLKGYKSLDYDGKAFINTYLKEFNIGKSIEVEHRLDYQMISVSIVAKDGGKRELVDFGYGIKQLILILIQISVLAQKNKRLEHYYGEYGPETRDVYDPSALLIEEPETNLHPKWQSLLAEMFVEANKKFNIQFIIESHSEYLIRKFQTLVAKTMLDSAKIKIFYLRDLESVKSGGGRKQIETVNISPDGTIDYKVFDGGFFDAADVLEMSLLNIQRDKILVEFDKLKAEKADGDTKIGELETKIDEYAAKADISAYERRIARDLNISKLSATTVKYLASGEYLLANINDTGDFSPVIIQYGRALENELKLIFNEVEAKDWMLGPMQGSLEFAINGTTAMVRCSNAQVPLLRAELDAKFIWPANLRIDLLEDLRTIRNSAGHAGAVKTKAEATAYIALINQFLLKWIEEKKS